MDRFVQDKVSPPQPQTRTVDAENQVNCLAVNKDFSLVVLAGRNVFKVYSLNEEKINEKYNLRSVQRLNLTYGASDLAWSPHDENIIASASTNGSIVFWNLQKTSKNKQDQVHPLHSRSVNSLCFHPQEPYLLSCANDSVCKLTDLRQRTPATSFQSAYTHMHDVKWWPKEYFKFAAAAENGNIQIWDYRQPNACYKEFPAHNGPIFALDFHPEERCWLASSGRDKLIKVWNLTENQPVTSHLHQIPAIAGVSKIKWRPNRNHQIASTAMTLDFGVSVWDLGRPFIPVATFNEHKNVVTSVVWKSTHVFLTAGKDNKLIEHVFRDAHRPVEKMTPVALTADASGCFSLAVTHKLFGSGISRTSAAPPSQSTASMIGNFFNPAKKTDKREEFITENSSYLFTFKNSADGCLQDFDPDWFKHCAKNYLLPGSGKSYEELCQHNSEVAAARGHVQIETHWTLLKIFYGASYTSPAQQNKITSHSLTSELQTKAMPDGLVFPNPEDKLEQELTDNDFRTSGISDQDDSDELGPEIITNPTANQDFFFEDNEINEFEFQNDYEDNLPYDEGQWVLPTESFQPSHDLTDSADPKAHDLPAHHIYSNVRMNSNTADPFQGSDKQPEKIQVTYNPTDLIPLWDPTNETVAILKSYAERGDVQTAVSMAIVLGTKVKAHLDEILLERWATSYIELLDRFKLWCEATSVIKQCGVKEVAQINQQSTTMHTMCAKCNKPLTGKLGWACDKCRAITSICALCHLPVKGPFVWCQGCAHGGHMSHMREWYAKNKACPTGCGHMCQFV